MDQGDVNDADNYPPYDDQHLRAATQSLHLLANGLLLLVERKLYPLIGLSLHSRIFPPGQVPQILHAMLLFHFSFFLLSKLDFPFPFLLFLLSSPPFPLLLLSSPFPLLLQSSSFCLRSPSSLLLGRTSMPKRNPISQTVVAKLFSTGTSDVRTSGNLLDYPLASWALLEIELLPQKTGYSAGAFAKMDGQHAAQTIFF